MGKIWIARDSECEWLGWYSVSANSGKIRMVNGAWYEKKTKKNGSDRSCAKLCPSQFHKANPKIRLKPGEGPYRYTVEMTLEKE